MARGASDGSQARLAYIDTLRGLAALYVVLYHTALMPSPALQVPPSIGALVLTGGTGVTLFFVVSAFTLCLSMDGHVAEPDAVRRYFIRRFFRIVPLFYVWVALSWVRDAVAYGVYHPARQVLLNLVFVYNFVPGEETSIVWAGWTLGVEMIFYLCFPLIFRWVTSVWRAAAFFGAAVALAVLHDRLVRQLGVPANLLPSYLQFSFFRMLPVFAIGVLAYRVHAHLRDRWTGHRGLSVLFVATACAGYWKLIHGAGWLGLDGLYWQALLYALLLLGLSVVPWRIFVNRPTVYLGKISYSLYLNHPTLIVLLFPVFPLIYALPGPLLHPYLVCALLTTSVVIVASVVTYYLIEQPGIRFGSRLTRRGRQSAAVAEGTAPPQDTEGLTASAAPAATTPETIAPPSSPTAPLVRAVPAGGDDVLVHVEDVSKRYHIYDRPQDRLWQGIFRGRRRFFRDFWALKNVSFELHRGETVGIIGRNGSGKSTLLQIVCGTLEPTTGAVRVRGKVAALLELGSGFNPEFTGRENVYMNGAILGLSRREIDARFDTIVAFADIGPFIDQPVKTYSSGMTVRLAFAVVAHVDADLLVIDEALAVGDAVFTQKCMRFLREFQQRGSILFVSHDTAAVLNLCQRAIWLDAGTAAEMGAAKPVVQAYVRATIEAAQHAEVLAAGPVTPVAASPEMTTAAEAVDAAALAVQPEAAPVDAEASSFGARGAVIQSVEVLDANGQPGTSFFGGDAVTLRVRFVALKNLDSVIVGFHLKDRLGQVLFGENTCEVTAGAPVSIAAGTAGTALFQFSLPLLRTGKYALDVAVAEGTLAQHVQHQWIFDVLVIHVVTDRPIYGLFLMPETTVSIASSERA